MFHLTSVQQLTREQLDILLAHTNHLRELPREVLRRRKPGSIMATLFYEPSTRTRMSFESGMLRLGGHVVTAENAQENSSAKKGETLEDVFRVVGGYADILVVRHHESDTMALASKLSPVPIVNAGAGSGEHPTQALLDAYTIVREVGHLDELRITFIGDLKYGRTVHSLLKLLTKFEGVKVTLVHPEALGLDPKFTEELCNQGLTLEWAPDVKAGLMGADVVYQTRIQTERLQSSSEARCAHDYHIGVQHLEHLGKNTIIMHPLPRVDEIHADVDLDPRAAYFRQAENGVYVRMALCDAILGGVLK